MGLFLLGLFVPFSNSIGAFIGTLASLLFSVWLFVGFNLYDIKYPKKEFFTYGCEKKNFRRILGLDNPQRPALLLSSIKNTTANYYFTET